MGKGLNPQPTRNMKKQKIEIGDFVTFGPIHNLTLFGTVVGYKDTKTLEVANVINQAAMPHAPRLEVDIGLVINADKNKHWKKDLELTTNK
tara:strand:+ start:453 stop:725 length:273 start_codon:yes stop_codon:yes gene_type:complete